jgi:DNA (cytosine-5)-methyltransferase 1
MKAVSLFASGGIGDLALRASGIDMVVANELLSDRADVLKFNFPDSEIVVGDIWQMKEAIVNACSRHDIEVMFATPPCQGMSKNGRGKLLSEIRNGNKEAGDKRNLLVIPAIDIYLSLKSAHTLVMENVPEMENTCILDPDENRPTLIIDYILRRLGTEYVHERRVVEFADYGVPQRRQRLISIFSKHSTIVKRKLSGASLFPKPTHAKKPDLLCPNSWVTVREAISHLPRLDASSRSTASNKEIELHHVPLLDEKKYFWVSNTPPESGAFDNQCVVCGCDDNPTHMARRNIVGINQASKDTPIYCHKCNSLLPRPTSENADGSLRLMSGFTSAYRRMKWDEPSSTLTRNLSYACSDKKLHPDQNRVLSLYEAIVLHTIDDYDYQWRKASGGRVSDKLIRDVIGESIPPRGLQVIFSHFFDLLRSCRIRKENGCHAVSAIDDAA